MRPPLSTRRDPLFPYSTLFLSKWPDQKAVYADVELLRVGQLQSNKAVDAVELFDAIHSVDRPSLVAALAVAMEKTGRRPDCFIQVNIDRKSTRLNSSH